MSGKRSSLNQVREEKTLAGLRTFVSPYETNASDAAITGTVKISVDTKAFMTLFFKS